MLASQQTRWFIVVASMLGLIVVSGTINVFGFAVFVKPVCSALGISRSRLASGVLLMSVLCSLGTPCLGVLADRYGSRRILLMGIPLFALSISAFAFLEPSPLVMYALFAIAGTFGAMHNTVPYAKVISKWFDDKRGLALGVAMSGIGLGIAVVPQFLKLLITDEGWRCAYAGLGAFIMLCAFVPVILFVREPSVEEMRRNASVGDAPYLAGMTFAQAAAGWRFWAMGTGFFIAVVSTNGTLAHAIAMLTDRGLSVERATAALSVAGIGVILGRLVSGWCLDRFPGPYVSFVFFALPAAGIVMLATDATMPLSCTGMAFCGVGLGAHVGMLAFFTSRYFGLKAYGQIYGLLFGMFLMGAGVGPFIAGLSFDYLGTYVPALIGFATALLSLSALFLPMGPYPFAVAKTKLPEVALG
ncbi:MAG TPA: MFS transporter [Candidatus Binataceae bacterium]|nr:MFS transporter [Candidatus Binataceae bacterium]